MEKGYIKLSRKFFDNEMWQAARTFSECEAWLDLIQSARFEASPTTSCIGSCKVTWGRGQYPASVRFLSKKWGRGERWVRVFLTKLKKEGMIAIENSQGVSVITLVNYDKYNDSVKEENGTPKDTVSDTPKDTDKYVTINKLKEIVTQIATQVVTQHTEKGHTYDTNNKKEEENNKETSTNVDAKKGKPSAYDNFLNWMKENTPTVLTLDKQVTEKQYLKIREQYSYQQLVDVLLAMENYKGLKKKYVSVYLTFLQWAKKRYGTE